MESVQIGLFFFVSFIFLVSSGSIYYSGDDEDLAVQKIIDEQNKKIERLEERVEILEEWIKVLVFGFDNTTTAPTEPTTPTTGTTTSELSEGCPPQFLHLRVGGQISANCYYFGRSTSYRAARATCLEKDGILAEFPSNAEYEIVKEYLDIGHTGQRYWIGGTDQADYRDGSGFIGEAPFTWPKTNTPIQSAFWLENEPSRQWQGKEEHCLSFDGRGRDQTTRESFTGFGLNDEFCHGQWMPHICQARSTPYVNLINI